MSTERPGPATLIAMTALAIILAAYGTLSRLVAALADLVAAPWLPAWQLTGTPPRAVIYIDPGAREARDRWAARVESASAPSGSDDDPHAPDPAPDPDDDDDDDDWSEADALATTRRHAAAVELCHRAVRSGDTGDLLAPYIRDHIADLIEPGDCRDISDDEIADAAAWAAHHPHPVHGDHPDPDEVAIERYRLHGGEGQVRDQVQHAIAAIAAVPPARYPDPRDLGGDWLMSERVADAVATRLEMDHALACESADRVGEPHPPAPERRRQVIAEAICWWTTQGPAWRDLSGMTGTPADHEAYRRAVLDSVHLSPPPPYGG